MQVIMKIATAHLTYAAYERYRCDFGRDSHASLQLSADDSKLIHTPWRSSVGRAAGATDWLPPSTHATMTGFGFLAGSYKPFLSSATLIMAEEMPMNNDCSQYFSSQYFSPREAQALDASITAMRPRTWVAQRHDNINYLLGALSQRITTLPDSQLMH